MNDQHDVHDVMTCGDFAAQSSRKCVQKPNFLTLPLELRDMVYLHALAGHAHIPERIYVNTYGLLDKEHCIMSLLNVCRQVRKEVFYHINKVKSIVVVLSSTKDYARFCSWAFSSPPRATIGAFGFSGKYNITGEWRKDWFYDDVSWGMARGVPKPPPRLFLVLDTVGSCKEIYLSFDVDIDEELSNGLISLGYH